MILCTLHIHSGNFDQLWLNDNPYSDAVFDDLWKQVEDFQQAGGVVTAMIGGASGGGISMLEFDQNKDKYFDLVCKFLREKKMQGIDLDIESNDNACDNENTLKLIQRFRQVFGSTFIVTMAPMAGDMTLTSGSAFSRINYPTLYKQSVEAKCPIDWFNCQFYNTYYTMNSPNDYNRIITFGLKSKTFSAWQIVAGVITTGVIDYKTFNKSVKSLTATHSTTLDYFGGVMGWEYFDSDPSGTSAPQEWTRGVRKTMNEAKNVPARIDVGQSFIASVQSMVAPFQARREDILYHRAIVFSLLLNLLVFFWMTHRASVSGDTH